VFFEGSRSPKNLIPMILIIVALYYMSEGIINFGLYNKYIAIKMTMKECAVEFEEGKKYEFNKSD
jgi:hypothetical protein